MRSCRVVLIVAAFLLGACRRRTAVELNGPLVMIPAGLDSAQTAAWIARQREACKGVFALISDRAVFAVQCTPIPERSKPPSDER